MSLSVDAIDFMDPDFNLLDFDDMEVFLKGEGELCRRKEKLSVRHRFVADANLMALERQAAWLSIEKIFSDRPEMEGISLNSDDEDDFLMVSFNYPGSENGPGEDPDGLDESLQIYLSDMGRRRHHDFFDMLKKPCLDREDLNSCAATLLGDAWVAAAKAKRLEKSYPPVLPTSPETAHGYDPPRDSLSSSTPRKPKCLTASLRSPSMPLAPMRPSMMPFHGRGTWIFPGSRPSIFSRTLLRPRRISACPRTRRVAFG